MTQIGETMINPDFRPQRQMSKTFFRQQQDLSVTTPKEILGDFAYFSFGMSIPEYDMYGCDAEQASSADAVHKPLPPSLMILAGSLGGPAAYSKYVEPSSMSVLILNNTMLRRSLLHSNMRRGTRSSWPHAQVRHFWLRIESTLLNYVP
jgi:hypothetical protein